MRRFFTLWLVSVLLFAGASRVRADGVADEAEVNFRLGTERYQAGDFRAALAYFLASNRLAPNRHVRFNIARAFQRLGEFPEAHRWCSSALSGETDPQVRAQLEDTLRSIEQQVSVLVVESTPPGAVVYVDRQDLGSLAQTPSRLALPEGSHRVIVHLDGYEDATSEELVMERGKLVTQSFVLRRIVGLVEVSAEAATEVRVDDVHAPPSCVAPCHLELAPGLHELYFERSGYIARSQQVQVDAGQVARVEVEATPRTGSLLVTADEPAALVEVDGSAVGFTPVVVRNVPVGARKVRLSLAGFEPTERTVEVREDAQAALNDVQLEPRREVVAASRVRQSIDDAPASVSIVGAQELAAFRYPTIAEALRGQRGVAISDDGAYTGLTLRGLGQPGDYGNRVLVLSDGATLNDNILWQSYVGYDGRVDLDDVERVELVRGPGSVLYGTGAVTGVVNLVPRAVPTRPTTSFRLGTAGPNVARGRASGGAALGKHGGFTLSAAGARGAGERIDVRTPSSVTPVNGVRRFDAATGNARLVYRSLSVQAFLSTRRQEVPQGAYGALLNHHEDHLTDTRGLVEARYEPVISERVHVFARAFGNMYRFRSQQSYAGTTSAVSRYDERYRGAWFGAEARVVASLLPGLRLTGGAEVQLDPQASLRGKSREAGTTHGYLKQDDPYQTYAAYGLLTWDPARFVTASAGARLDAWSTFGFTVNPRLSLLFRPSDNDVIKLMSGRAFRAPSIYELRYGDGGITQVASNYRGNRLRPEVVWSAELEYTHRFDDGWSGLLSTHMQRAKDFIMQVSTAPGTPGAPVFYDNGGSTVSTYGGDAELRREFRAGWMFAASYGALVADYAHAAKGTRRVPNAPQHFASIRGVAPLNTWLKLALRSTLDAPRRISTATQATTRPALITDLVLSGQTLRGGVDYALGLYNLFDARVALPTDPTFVSSTMPQPGRSLLLSLGLTL